MLQYQVTTTTTTTITTENTFMKISKLDITKYNYETIMLYM